jgi:type I restriction enzyme S subunit
LSSAAQPELLGNTGIEYPADWSATTLGELFDIQQGKALNSRLTGQGQLTPFLRTANVLWGRIDLSHVDQMEMTQDEINRLRLVPGDLLVCEGGDIGRTAVWSGELSVCAHQNHVHRLRAKQASTVPQFYAYWMQAALTLLGLYGGEGNKTTIPNLSKSRLAAFHVPRPPAEGQRRIARVLFTIQHAIEAQDKVIAAARELKRSLMRHLFTYGPVPASEAGRVMMKQTEVGDMPRHWSTASIASLCTHIVDCPHSTPKWTDSGVLAIKNVNIRDGQLRLAPGFYTSDEHYAERVKRLEPRTGDVLLSREAPIGEACLVPPATRLCLGQRIMLMRTDQRLLVNRFLVYVFYSPGIRPLLEAKGKGVTAQHINVADVRALCIPLPPLGEQAFIADALMTADMKLASEQKRKVTLEVLFKSMLHRLLTGKLRVGELEG